MIPHPQHYHQERLNVERYIWKCNECGSILSVPRKAVSDKIKRIQHKDKQFCLNFEATNH